MIIVAKRPVSIRDVARRAGVSISTVSRALNNYDDISEDTYNRVIATAKELGYHPNRFARGLVTQKTNIIGFVLADHLVNPVMDLCSLEFMQGILGKAKTMGYNVCLLSSNIDQPGDATRSLLEECFIEGVIFQATQMSESVARKLWEWRIPFVTLGKFDLRESDQWYSVGSDDFGGGFQATIHLADLGHKRIGYIGEDHSFKVAGLQERFEGYRKALESRMLPYDESLVGYGDLTLESGYQTAMNLLKVEDRPTAIFAASDQMAIGAVKAAFSMGIDVPSQLAVVGFDDLETASFVHPALTTVRQHIRELGSIAAQMLIEALENRVPEAKHLSLPTHLVVRDSCGAALLGKDNPSYAPFDSLP